MLTRSLHLSSILLVLIIGLASSCNGQESDQQYQSINLHVLGVAQDAGYPQIDCKKDCCKEVWNQKDKHQKVVSLGLSDPLTGKYWLFEATPDIKFQWKDLKVLVGPKAKETPEQIFISHAHIGHYTGLMFLGHEAMGASQIQVNVMPKMAEFLKNNGPWSQLVTKENIIINTSIADSSLELQANLKVEAILVPHRDEFSETVGFVIATNSKRVLFIPDIDKWSKWDKNIVEMIRNVDYAFLDGTFYANGEIPGRDMSLIPHPFIEESISLFKDLPDSEKKKIYFIHFNHTNPLLNAQSDESQTVLREGFNIAREGMSFKLD